MKSWSYKQITESVERSIRNSHECADADGNPEGKRIHRLFAIGAYNAWSALTMGWQKKGDGERLEKLAQAVGRSTDATAPASVAQHSQSN